jgi:hypothetical protein
LVPRPYWYKAVIPNASSNAVGSEVDLDAVDLPFKQDPHITSHVSF